MGEWEFYLDEYLIEQLFLQLEIVQDGKEAHKVVINASSKKEAAQILSQRLVPFFEGVLF